MLDKEHIDKPMQADGTLQQLKSQMESIHREANAVSTHIRGVTSRAMGRLAQCDNMLACMSIHRIRV